jgi:hypothetical protein
LTDETASNADTEKELERRLDAMRTQVSSLEQQIEFLTRDYRRVAGKVSREARPEVDAIKELRSEAEHLVGLLRGGSLFGRYAADAGVHAKTANAWRAIAVGVLVLAIAFQVVLPLLVDDVGWQETVGPAVPLLLLFTYASIESFNHRRKELDRRRTYLRIAAIESYLGPDHERSEDDKQLMRLFIEKHFIDPELDPTETKYVVARGSGPAAPQIGGNEK